MKRVTLTFSDAEYAALRELTDRLYTGIPFATALKSALLIRDASSIDQHRSASISIDQHLLASTPSPARARGSSSGSKKEKEKKEKEQKRARLAPLDISERIIADLNRRAGTSYRAKGKRVRQLLALRLAEGFAESDFIAVHRKKCGDWLGGEMQKYLRPETLYGPKFEQYAGQLEMKAADPPASPPRGLYIAGEGWHHYEGDHLVPGPYPD